MRARASAQTLGRELNSIRARLLEMEQGFEKRIEDSFSAAMRKMEEAVTPAASSGSGATRRGVSPGLRRRLIAELAYRRAEQRGFADHGATDDWLAAERDVDHVLSGLGLFWE